MYTTKTYKDEDEEETNCESQTAGFTGVIKLSFFLGIKQCNYIMVILREFPYKKVYCLGQ